MRRLFFCMILLMVLSYGCRDKEPKEAIQTTDDEEIARIEEEMNSEFEAIAEIDKKVDAELNIENNPEEMNGEIKLIEEDFDS
ncbi:MAG: hypothetical protein ABH872_05445 [Candidatus Omnitrophota bacterium]